MVKMVGNRREKNPLKLLLMRQCVNISYDLEQADSDKVILELYDDQTGTIYLWEFIEQLFGFEVYSKVITCNNNAQETIIIHTTETKK